MRTCIMTVLSDPFVYGAIALFGSFRATNPWFEGDIVVLSNPEVAPLSMEARARLEEAVGAVEFREVDLDPYADIFRFAESVIGTPPRLRAALLILEAFRTDDYDCVVTLDSDMLVIGDIAALLRIDAPFAVARAVDWVSERPLPYFNTGTMVVRRNHPQTIGFDAIVAALDVTSVDGSHGKGDQAVLNIALRGHDRHVLDERYNFSKRLRPPPGESLDAFLARRDVRIFHFLGQKPWNLKTRWSETGYADAEELWRAAFLRHASPMAVCAYLRDINAQGEAVLGYVTPADGTPETRRRENALTRFFEDRLYGVADGPEPIGRSGA